MFCLSDQTPAIGANEMQSAKKKLRTQSLVSKQRNFFTFKSYDLYFRSSGKPFIKKKKENWVVITPTRVLVAHKLIKKAQSWIQFERTYVIWHFWHY